MCTATTLFKNNLFAQYFITFVNICGRISCITHSIFYGPSAQLSLVNLHRQVTSYRPTQKKKKRKKFQRHEITCTWDPINSVLFLLEIRRLSYEVFNKSIVLLVIWRLELFCQHHKSFTLCVAIFEKSQSSYMTL